MSDNNLDKSDYLTLLGYTVDDIKQMRLQQWRITNYVLLLDLALAGLLVREFPKAYELHWICLSASMFVLIMGICIMSQAQFRLVEYRERLIRIFSRLPNEYGEIWGKNEDENYTSFWYGGLVLLTLYIVQAIGFIFLLLFILYGQGVL